MIDMTGFIFNKLTIKSFSHRKGKHYYWLCRCECGNEKTVRIDSLKTGHTQSCGCIPNSKPLHNIKHGYCSNYHKERTYKSWLGMKERCYKSNNKKFIHYGARGITVCDRWLNSFENFLADMGKCPSNNHSIDRIDNNGNYEPNNCKWSTFKEQSNNTRRNRLITFNDITMTLTQWAEKYNLRPLTLLNRINSNWSIKEALTLPLQKNQWRNI